MPRSKAERIAHFDSLPNVIGNYDRVRAWPDDRRLSFPSPVTMELGCGRADFLLQLAAEFPDRVFVGVDKKAARLWAGASAALAHRLNNAFFVRSEIEYLPQIFAPGVARDIWLLFPDPYPQFGKSRKRLTSPRFLQVYAHLLGSNGRVHLKTDDQRLFKFTLETLKHEGCDIHAMLADVHRDGPVSPIAYQTSYERRYIEAGRIISYVSFTPAGVFRHSTV